MFKFKIYDENILINQFDNYYIALHELLSYYNNKKKVILTIEIDTYKKTSFPIKINNLYIQEDNLTNDLLILSDNKTYNLTKFTDLYSLLNLYNNKNNDINQNYINNEIISSIIKLLHVCPTHYKPPPKITTNNNDTILHKNNNNTTPMTKLNEEISNDEFLYEKNLINNILSKKNNNTTSIIKLNEEMSNDCIDEILKQKSEEKNPKINIEKIQFTIDELENIKNITDSTILNFENEIEDENENLNTYIEKYNKEKISFSKDEEKKKQKEAIYLAGKDTYKKILKSMIKSGGVSFDKIPILFNDKFPIFLFMDGKDNNGEDVREKLFGVDDEIKIFDTLHESLINDDINIEDNDDIELIEMFADFLPNGYQAMTEKEIMIYENEKNDNLNKIIFREKETDQEECVAEEGCDTFIPPSY
jgi:predicted HTH domain antitoxin